MTRHSSGSKAWLKEQIIAIQSGKSTDRQTSSCLAKELLPILRDIAALHQRRAGLSTFSKHVTEDAASHAYAAFLRNISTFKEPYDVLAWLHVVIFNFLVSERRKLTRTFPTDEVALLETKMRHRPHALSVATQVRAAVKKLPKLQRTAVFLYYWEELSHDEIAQRLGVARTAVSSRLDRARFNLRKILLEDGFVYSGWADDAM